MFSAKIIILGKYTVIHIKEIIFASSEQNEIKRNARLLSKGLIRKIAPKIYSANLTDKPEEIIRRNIFDILANMYSGAVLSHRSAIEIKPTSANIIFVTYTYTKKIELPGITISFLKGKGALSDDLPFKEGLHISQLERALLENLEISKKPGSESKTLTLPEIEEKLEAIISTKGETELNQIRDRARVIAKKLQMKKEFKKLNLIISSLLSTKPSSNLKSPVAIARAIGSPFDTKRINLFESLFSYLINNSFPTRIEKNTTTKAFRNFAFFESYFSNYIEGTIFEIDEAKKIIETGRVLANRNNDSHDILGTYQLVSNKKEI